MVAALAAECRCRSSRESEADPSLGAREASPFVIIVTAARC